MKFSGELFIYDEDSRLTAFETGPTESTETVVFIGGLGDGFNAVPFLEPLEKQLTKLNYSLIQVQLSSSNQGYGTSNLQTDSKELDLLVTYLKDKRGKTKIIFLGHSTGCQDCYWHNKYGKTSQHIAGYILQAPVSDREHFKANLPNFEKTLDLAIKYRKEGKGQELLPRDSFDAPITADRFFSFSAKGGDDDVFSTDLSEEKIRSLFKGVDRPICWVYSDNDEFYASKEDKVQVMERFQNLCPAIKVTENVPHGDHCIVRQDSQEYFVKVVHDFLTKTI